jgi:hypothetical protein
VAEITLPYNYRPRSYQLPSWEFFQRNIEGLRGVNLWHRRAGKDLFAINLVAVKHLQRRGMYWHLLPTYKQGRSIVWNGFTRDGRSFLSHFPKEIVSEKNKTEMKVTFTNGSMYQVVGTDDVNSLVGTNPVGCIFSEYSLHDPGAWDYLRPILAENGGWALFIYTSRGKNHGYRMYEMARKNKRWHCEKLIAGNEGTKRDDGTPVISDQIIQQEREEGMTEEMIQQEFYLSFDAPLVGSYFGKQMMFLDSNKRICKVPWDPNLPVHTAWDLGIDDEMVVWFVQEYGMEVRVIDHWKASGESIISAIRMLRGKDNCIIKPGERDGTHRAEYVYGKHYAPHDIVVREMTSGKARIDTAAEHGIRFTVVDKHEVEDGIEACRQLLPMCWFDEELTDRGVQALKSYRKEFDERNKTFKNSPLHDWSSHDADAFRTYAWGRKPHKRNQDKPQRRAKDDFNYLG